MTVLHLLKSPPDDSVRVLMAAWQDRNDPAERHLYRDDVDYDDVLDMILACDKTITWF